MRVVILSLPLYRSINGGVERCYNVPKVTSLITDGDDIQIHIPELTL